MSSPTPSQSNPNGPAARGPVIRRVLAGVLAAAVALAVTARVWRNPPPAAPPLVPAVDHMAIQPLVQLERKDGRLCRPGEAGPYSGWVTEAHADASLKLKTEVVNGLWNGLSEGWATNGVLVLREHFKEGLPHGMRTTWHPNGKIKSEGRVVDGKQQGDFQQWDEQGRLVTRARFQDGQPEGLSLAWYPSGFLKAEALMNAGTVQSRNFYPDGERSDPTLLAGLSDQKPH